MNTKHLVINCCIDEYFKAKQPDLVGPFVTAKKNCCTRRVTGDLWLGLNFICCFASPNLNDCVDSAYRFHLTASVLKMECCKNLINQQVNISRKKYVDWSFHLIFSYSCRRVLLV